jgi:hypothetical protein
MTDKSHVGMTRCFYCNEYSEILLDMRLRKRLPRDCGVINMRPCSKCEGYMKQGIIVIVVQKASLEAEERRLAVLGTPDKDHPQEGICNPNRTGIWVVVREEALRRLVRNEKLLESILRYRWTFMDDETAEATGLAAQARASAKEAAV